MDLFDMVYISRSDRQRKASDFLSAYNDILFVCDFFAGVLLGYASGLIYVRYSHFGLPIKSIIGPFLREVMLGSVIAALVLREPRLAIDQELFAPRRLLEGMRWRAIAAISIILGIGLATRGLDDMARLWLLGWCALLLVYVWVSRVGVVAYLHHLAMDGALREAIAVAGAPDVERSLAARDAEETAEVRESDDLDANEFATNSRRPIGRSLPDGKA